MSTSPAQSGTPQWKEYKNAEGRVYWSHVVTKQSVWEKPDELKTPFERAMANTAWKKYNSKGREYYVNSMTKETLWDLPPELVQLKDRVEAEEVQRREREHRKATGQATPTPEPESRSRSGSPSGSGTPNHGQVAKYRERSRSASPAPAPEVETVVIPPGGFTTHEKAEAAFLHLLKREGIDEKWTWDATMRRIVQDPLFKALDTLAQKKAAFEKWQAQLSAENKAKHAARIAELRPHLTRLFANSGVIQSFSTLKTANGAFAGDKYWRRADPEVRRELLEAYTTELRNREQQEKRKRKEASIAALSRMIKDLDITVTTRWVDAEQIIADSDAFRRDPSVRGMETLDILNVFDEYMRQLEKEHDEESRRLLVEHKRKARKAREGFKELLRELIAKGELARTSKWKDTLPKFRTDERYTALLGLPGSNPLDLWMDEVDVLQVAAEDVTRRVAAALRDAGKSAKEAVTLETTLENFEELCAGVDGLTPEDRKTAFEVIHGRLTRAAAEEARRAERKRRHRMDDLRDALRKVRSIEAETTYDAALPAMQALPEFKDVETDEDRRAAFEKHTRRLRDKGREAEGSDAGRRDRDRDRDHRDRDRHRMDVDDDHRRRADRDWRDSRDRDRDRDRRDRDRDHGRDRDRDRDHGRDRDRDYRRSDYRDDHRERERERDRRERDRERERERERDRDRERERERDRERDKGRRGEQRERERDGLAADDRDPKRRRVSESRSVGASASGPGVGAAGNEEREEGEI